MPAGTLAILNPCAGNAAKLLGRIETRLRGSLADVLGGLEIERTRGPRDASRIAREAVRAGVKRLVVGGGDGTLAEVVTGLLEAGLGEDAEMGILPLGTGSDFRRALGVPLDLGGALEVLASRHAVKIDMGKASYLPSGKILDPILKKTLIIFSVNTCRFF